MKFVYSSTRSYYPFMLWSITSLLEYNEVEKIYILAEDDTIPFDIPCQHEIINYSGQTYFTKDCPNYNSPWAYIALIYVLIPEFLKKEDKIIYLDQDTVILENLQPLWDMDLSGKWGAWCPERTGTWKPYGDKYYNSAVSVMNLLQMRLDCFAQKCADELNKEWFRYTAQDAFNKILPQDKVVDLDTRFNESFCCGYTDNPAIIHYAGVMDWMYNKRMYRHEYLDKYREGKIL